MSPVLLATVQTTGVIVQVLVNPDGTLIASGGGGALTPVTGIGDPNGSVTGTLGQFYSNTADNTVWISAGGTIWNQVIGASGLQTLTFHGSPNGTLPGTVGQLCADLDNPGQIYQSLGGTAWGP